MKGETNINKVNCNDIADRKLLSEKRRKMKNKKKNKPDKLVYIE